MTKNGGNQKLKYLGPHQQWYGFLRPFALEMNKIIRLQVRQTKTTCKQIMYGVSTDKTIGMVNPYMHLECKIYHAWGGSVW